MRQMVNGTRSVSEGQPSPTGQPAPTLPIPLRMQKTAEAAFHP